MTNKKPFSVKELETMSWKRIKRIDVVGATHKRDRPFVAESEYALKWSDLRVLFRRAIMENVPLEHSQFYLQNADFYSCHGDFLGVENRQQALDYVCDIATSNKNPVSLENAKKSIDILLRMANCLPKSSSDVVRIGSFWYYNLRKDIISFANHSDYGINYGGEEYVWSKKSVDPSKIYIAIGKGVDSFPGRD